MVVTHPGLPPRIVYLKSYDVYDDFLRYELPEGRFSFLRQRDFEALGIPAAFGAFTREGERVAGIFSSPRGPVVFVDSRHVIAVFGHTSAAVEPASAPSMLQFTLIHDVPLEEKIILTLLYKERDGLFANPYDTEPKDIDLCALLADGLSREQFVRAYTKD